MTTTANWKDFVQTPSEETIAELKEFLEPYGLDFVGKGSIVHWTDKSAEWWIGIDKKGKATYAEDLGIKLKKKFGIERLYLDCREV